MCIKRSTVGTGASPSIATLRHVPTYMLSAFEACYVVCRYRNIALFNADLPKSVLSLLELISFHSLVVYS